MHITPNNKLASFGTIGLLFLAGIAGMVFLLPAAHAASATVTLSTISPLSSTLGGPTELTGVTSGTVGTTLTITGTGFASNAPISVTSTVGTSTASWFPSASNNNCGGNFAAATGGVNGVDSLTNGFSPTGCVTTTAVGSFKSSFTVPALPGGPNTIVASDGTNTVSTPFTITPTVSFSKTGSNFGFPEQAIAGTLSVTGFGSGETVTIATAMWATTSLTCTTGTTLGGSATTGAGSCQTAVSTSILDTTGGSKTVTATGGTSALTASTTFTVNAWAAFYNSNNDQTTFSFIGSAPTSLLIEVHGATSGTIAANSITVGGIATNHASYTVGSAGTVFGLVVSPTANVPFGNVAVVVQGNTFNYASGNIASGAVSTPQAISTSGVSIDIPWGGALISSIQGTTASTGIASLDATSYKPGTGFTASTSSPKPVQNQMGFFGYGFVPPTATCGNAANGGAVSIGTPAGVTYSAGPTFFQGTGPGTAHPDCNGAFFATAGLGDTAWSTTGAPTVAASYAPTVSQGAVGFPANVLSPNFGVQNWDKIGSSTVDYTTSNFQVTGHGFGPTDTLTATIGGASTVSGATGFGTCVVASTGTCQTIAAQVPDLGAGPQTVLLSGSISGQSISTSGGVTYDPFINGGGSAGTQTLNSVAGVAGSTTIIRTGTTFGVHGLYPNTAYSIVWNAGVAAPGTTGTVLGTFTSTATGGIPVPGVQFIIPADTSGIHIIDLQRTSTIGTSMMFADNLHGDYNDVDPGLGTTALSTNYGDMLFNEGTSLTATPTVANVGGNVAITGTGLQANTLYDLGISIAGTGASSPPVPTTCTIGTSPLAQAPTTIAGQFTSTGTGTVPASTSVAITDMPTYAGLEQGTLYCIFSQTGPNFGTTTVAGVAEFELQASANLNMTSAPSGHNVILSAHALNAGKGYNILFAPYVCGNNICGTVVGAILSNQQGAGSGTFTVPSTVQTSTGSQPVSSGSGYTVELQAVGTTTGVALASPPTLTVGSVSSTSCTSTSCMTASGASTVASLNGQKTVETSFTNNSNAPVTAIVYAVVHNAAGQTVAYSTSTITANAGASATAYNVLFGLAPGTYTVTIFVTTTGGVAISTASTVTVTV